LIGQISMETRQWRDRSSLPILFSLFFFAISLICKKYILEYILSRKDGITFFSELA